ncbi:MAG: DoxX family protein [Bacteroidaceae bacterium]|nr:DoxX family protein [Bacteroidaceae bacterium]
MTTEKSCPASCTDLGLLFLRITTSILLGFHGIAHLLDGAAGVKYVLSSVGLPEFLAYGSLVGELVAPVLILVGFRTRAAAAIMAFNMLVAIFTAHAHEIFAINNYGGWAIELPALYLFAAVTLVLTGGGRYGLSSSNCLD